MTYKNRKPSNVYNSKLGYDKYAKLYDKTLHYLDTFEKDKLIGLIGDINGKKILDVGCGTGRIVNKLRNMGSDIIGLDISKGMIDIAKKKFPKVKFIEGDIENLPFKDNEFDLVIASFVIVHLKDLQKAFDEVYRVLKPNGVFIVTNINQRKAPKLRIKNHEEIVIISHYHIPNHVIEALKYSFFSIEKEEFLYERRIWINQIVKAVKS